MTYVHQRSKMDCSLLLVCFQNNLFFAHYSGQVQSWQLFELVPLLVQCSICILNVQCLEHRNKFTHKCFVTHFLHPFSPQWNLRDLSVESLPNAFSQTHELLRCMQALFSGLCWIRWIRCRFLAAWMDVSSSSLYNAQRLRLEFPACSAEPRFLDKPLHFLATRGQVW